MKIFDLECNGCRRKYTFTFTMQSMQWPDVIAGIAAFEEAVFGFDCPACNYRNAFHFKGLIDMRLARAEKWADFVNNRTEWSMVRACQNPEFCCGMVSYWKFEELKRRSEKLKAFLDAVKNARLEIAGI